MLWALGRDGRWDVTGKVGIQRAYERSPYGTPTESFSAASIPIGSPPTGISLIPLRFGGAIHHPCSTCLSSRALEPHPFSSPSFSFSLSRNSEEVFHSRLLPRLLPRVSALFKVPLGWLAPRGLPICTFRYVCFCFSFSVKGNNFYGILSLFHYFFSLIFFTGYFYFRRTRISRDYIQNTFLNSKKLRKNYNLYAHCSFYFFCEKIILIEILI